MDVQSNTQVPVQKPSKQKQQSSTSLGSQTGNLQNSQRPTVSEPGEEGLKLWMWLVIAVVAVGLVVGIYSIFA